MEKGSYSRGKRYGFFFIKKIKPSTKIENIIYNNLNSDYKIVRRYVNDIKKVDIKCADVYYVSNRFIIERFINGKTIDQYINSDINDNEKISIIKRVFDLFRLSLKNSNLRIDWNLNNFILNKDEIFLIDYIPSLYMSNLSSINTDTTRDLFVLYSNLDIQLAGIIGYSMFPFLGYEKNKLKEIYKDIFKYADKIYKIDKKKKHVFMDRIILIDKYLSSNMTRDEFVDKYKSLSLSRKMKSIID